MENIVLDVTVSCSYYKFLSKLIDKNRLQKLEATNICLTVTKIGSFG